MHYAKSLIAALLIVCPFITSAQEKNLKEIDLTGLWKGTLYNDSTQLYYRYEIGISKEKGKLSGFSHTWFILDDKQFYGVKKLKISIKDNKVIAQDAELIAHNYPVDPAKGIFQLNVMDLLMQDSVMTLSGPFTTNRTKNYAALTGTVTLQRKNDYWQSSLVPHLQELGKSNELSFVEDSFALTKANVIIASRDDLQSDIEPAIKAPERTGADVTKLTPKVKNDQQEVPGGLVISENASIEKPIITPDKKLETPAQPAADLNKRTTVAQQVVYFKTDSLQLSLYDNGEVDGDTVSVLLNGNVIMAKQRLSTNAIRKTIFIDPLSDSIQIVLYAENLGTIAPNTGLLVVKDGRETYEVRFSGDLSKNAAVIFRRKK